MPANAGEVIRASDQPGEIGYAEVTADQGSVTNHDLTGLTVTVDVSSGHAIRITGSIGVTVDTESDTTATLRIREGSTILQEARIRPDTSARESSIERSVRLTPSSGSHTYKLTLVREVGTGTLTMEAGTSKPAFILVEDMGVAS